MTPTVHSSILLALLCVSLQACGGYKAADEDDLEPREGEIVGILVDERGKAHPDARLELYETDGLVPLQEIEGMDSDGRFGVFPPDTGSYSVVGVLGETDKVIVQNIEFTHGQGQSLGKIATQKVAGLSFRVFTPDNVSPEGIKVELLGYKGSTTTVAEGAALIETGIPAGIYKVRLSKEGLQTKTVQNLKLEPETLTILQNVSMTLAEP